MDSVPYRISKMLSMSMAGFGSNNKNTPINFFLFIVVFGFHESRVFGKKKIQTNFYMDYLFIYLNAYVAFLNTN